MKLSPKEIIRKQIEHKLRHNNITNNSRLYKKLFNSFWWRSARIISVTLSTSLEINTIPIIHKAWKQRKIVCVPKVYKHRQMKMIQITPKIPMIKDRYNILEPKIIHIVPKNRINLVIVPGLAFALFDKQRLGYGGGYYDKYLKDYHGITIGLADGVRLFKNRIWDANKNDVPVQTILH